MEHPETSPHELKPQETTLNHPLFFKTQMKLTKKSAPKNTLSPVPPVTLNLILKFKCASNSMKIETMNK